MIQFITYFTELIYIKNYTLNNGGRVDANKKNLIEFYSYFNRNIKILIYLLFYYPFVEIHNNAIEQMNSGSSADKNTIKQNSIEEYLNFIKIYYIENPNLNSTLKISEELKTKEFTNDDNNLNFFTKKIKEIYNYFDEEIDVTKDNGSTLRIKRINFALLYDIYKIDDSVNANANTNNENAINTIVQDINNTYNNFLKDIFDKFAIIINEIQTTSATSGGNIVKRKTRKHRNH
jgi:hypothetical protein